ncbi:hypothetical protein EIP86_009889 [Pleurotus ostreatoroseus]|nr:hypothetical protein EIP86_009889 [Pleurotus ostreatoroseus]
MSGIAVEVVKFESTEAFQADSRKTVSPLLELVGQTDGLINSHFGSTIQEPKTAFVINVWESLAKHDALVNDKPRFDEVLARFKGSCASLNYLVHAHFNAEPFIALKAPVTEFAHWSLKEGADKAVFEQKVDSLVKLAISWADAAGCHGGGWGPVAENNRQYFVLLGWNDLELFTKAVQASEQAMQLIGELKELADLELLHTNLAKF